MSAEPSLSGPAVIAYADTLIRAEFDLDPDADSVIWTKEVSNPEAYGVVNLNENNEITELVEKPSTFVSNQAVIGIYYFKEVGQLKSKLQEILDENIMNGGEYQINDGIKRMMKDGKVFKTGSVDEWMDCGNKEITLETNSKMLGFLEKDAEEQLVDKSVIIENSTVIPPCYIAKHTILKNSTIGPNVSLGENCVIENTNITESLIQNHTTVKNAKLKNAMIGNHVIYDGNCTNVSIGDYSKLEA